MAVIDLVKYNGSPNVFAWKFPSEELSTWTQLIVNESQEAVLFKGGQALDIFPAGKYTLDTGNIPVLREFIKLPFGKKSPFTAEVWYINKVFSLDIKWGTATPIQLQDPKYKVFVPVRAFGQFGVRIADSKKFLIKLVGTLPAFDKEHLVNFFRGLYLTKVKDAISSYLVHKQVSILEINAYLDEISEHLQAKLEPQLAEYGISLVNFYVNDINVPENDPGVRKLKDALAKRAEMEIVGYNYTQERSFDTLEGAAKNAGTGGDMIGAGIGLGLGVGVGGNLGSQVGGMGNIINTASTRKCGKCGSDVETDKKFCGMCGSPPEGEKLESTVKCNNCGQIFSQKFKFCPECANPYNPCPHCGADLDENAEKCTECGKGKPQACSSCGAAVPDDKMKFCPECGNSLKKTCAKCGFILDGSQGKFCPECGEKL